MRQPLSTECLIWPSALWVTREEELRFCQELNCPNRGNPFSQSLCIRKGKAVGPAWQLEGGLQPSVVFLFRDPTKGKPGPVEHVLNLRPREDAVPLPRHVASPYSDLFSSFHEGDVLCLDNFVRRGFAYSSGRPMSLADLNKLYEVADRTEAGRAMACCFTVTQSIVARLAPTRLVLTNKDNIRWLLNNGFLHGLSERGRAYIRSGEGHSCVLLGEPFRIEGWGFPVYFFPHPKSLGPRRTTHYGPGSPCRGAYERAIRLISGNA